MRARFESARITSKIDGLSPGGVPIMLTKLSSYRVNLVIVFFGAAFILFLIKLTPLLLPKKYYFSFSMLFSNASEQPFIIDPPTISGQRLCQLMRTHHISPRVFKRTVDCDLTFAAVESTKPVFSKEQVDEVYALALRTDAAARNAILDSANRKSVTPLADTEVREYASAVEGISDVSDWVRDHYSEQASSLIDDGARKSIEDLYHLAPEANKAEPDKPEKAETGAENLSEDIINRVVLANRAIGAKLNRAYFLNQLRPIKKSAIDDIIANAGSEDDLGTSIVAYYEKSMTDGLEDVVRQEFAGQKLPASREAEQQIILEEINKFSLNDYVISALIRLMPVFMLGLLVGAVAGQAELLSISVAGGLSAFLLSWPVMLLWDTVVTPAWSTKKPTFLTFYAVYVIAFFLMARSGGLVGAWIVERMGLASLIKSTGEKIEANAMLTWSKVAVGIASAAAMNALVFAWNIIVPPATAVPH
jgi:hypothetical protein